MQSINSNHNTQLLPLLVASLACSHVELNPRQPRSCLRCCCRLHLYISDSDHVCCTTRVLLGTSLHLPPPTLLFPFSLSQSLCHLVSLAVFLSQDIGVLLGLRHRGRVIVSLLAVFSFFECDSECMKRCLSFVVHNERAVIYRNWSFYSFLCILVVCMFTETESVVFFYGLSILRPLLWLPADV